MQIEKKPFELVIHIDEAGTRATASYRTRVFDDAGAVIDGATKMESVTLADLGTAFPWGGFVPLATQTALTQCETMTAQLATANTDKTAAETALKAAQDELGALKAVPAVQALAPDHQAIADAIYQNVMATINATAPTPDVVAEQTWYQKLVSMVSGNKA